MKTKVLKWSGIAIALILFVGHIVFSASINRAEVASQDALSIEYRKQDGNYHIETSNSLAHLVIYPGALVEPAAYLPLAEKIAIQGFDVHIIRMPFHLSILDSDAVESLDLDDGKPVFIGGHSLGGVAASTQVSKHPDDYDGLILIASYPRIGVDLSGWDKPVLTITASNDGVIDEAMFEDGFERLPESTVHYDIQGGNHANFGSYGTQRFDGEAEISRSAQQNITALKIGTMILNNLE